MQKKKIALIGLLAITLVCGCAPKVDLMALDQWDLVWISDSSGWGVAEVYAQMIEEDTGKQVIVHDQWQGGLAAGLVLSGLQGTPSPDMTLLQNADLIREAEVVVFYGNPEASGYDESDWICTSALESNYVNDCPLDSFDPYIADIEAIYEIIFELRQGQPTIVRAFDAYNPLINEFKEQGVYEECTACWANYNLAIHQAAESYGVPVAKVSLAWNGPDFDQDPDDLGYVKDGEHPNEVGAQVIAQALRETGYEPVEP